jgi:Copper fist DNA binding domain
MSPRIDAKATSPNEVEDKVQDGRVQKPKAKKRDGIVPNYRIDGRTFACEGCKNGHRVSKCTHAPHRPVLMTNDPGRPSADQKRHCDCPKTCSCTKKNCKCDRNCTCVQTMYMLVYVPMGECENNQEKQKGEWKIDHEIITDLKGKPLTEEEIESRRREKSRQKQGRTSRAGTLGAVNDRPPSQGSTNTTATSISMKTEMATTVAASTSESGCCHRKNVQEQSRVPEVKKENLTPVQVERPLGDCNCGDECACAMCLDHPNNMTSQRIIQRRAAQLWSNPSMLRGNALNQKSLTPPGEKSLSCMGTRPQFAFHTNPHPSEADFQTMFGQDATTSRGYCLSYPVNGYPSTPAAPGGHCCSSTMSTNHPDPSGHEGPSQFLPFVDPNADFLSTPHPLPNQHFTMATMSVPEQSTQQMDFSKSFNFGSDMFQAEHCVGQATVAGVYGMGDDWADFCANQPMTQRWPSANPDLESPCSTSSVIPNFENHAASFSIAPPGTLNHLNTNPVTLSLPPKTQTVDHGILPEYQAQYPYPPVEQDHSLKPGYTLPAIAPLSTYGVDAFTDLPLGDDFLLRMPSSNQACNPPDFGVAQTYPT